MGKYIFSAIMVVAAFFMISVDSSVETPSNDFSKDRAISMAGISNQNDNFNTNYQLFASTTTLKKGHR